MWVVKRETLLFNSFFSNVAGQVARFLLPVFPYLNITLKQPRRQGHRKLHLKSQFTLFQSSLMLSHFIQFVKCWGIFFRNFNSKGLFLISEKEKENCCLVFTSYVKRETRRCLPCRRATTAKNCTKTWIILSLQKSVKHEQSCCFADLNIVFCRSRWCPRRLIILGWFSNRTGTSVDDGPRKSNNWLDQWRVANWAPEVELGPLRRLSRRQMTFPFCC